MRELITHPHNLPVVQALVRISDQLLLAMRDTLWLRIVAGYLSCLTRPLREMGILFWALEVVKSVFHFLQDSSFRSPMILFTPASASSEGNAIELWQGKHQASDLAG